MSASRFSRADNPCTGDVVDVGDIHPRNTWVWQLSDASTRTSSWALVELDEQARTHVHRLRCRDSAAAERATLKSFAAPVFSHARQIDAGHIALPMYAQDAKGCRTSVVVGTDAADVRCVPLPGTNQVQDATVRLRDGAELAFVARDAGAAGTPMRLEVYARRGTEAFAPTEVIEAGRPGSVALVSASDDGAVVVFGPSASTPATTGGNADVQAWLVGADGRRRAVVPLPAARALQGNVGATGFIDRQSATMSTGKRGFFVLLEQSGPTPLANFSNPVPWGVYAFDAGSVRRIATVSVPDLHRGNTDPSLGSLFTTLLAPAVTRIDRERALLTWTEPHETDATAIRAAIASDTGERACPEPLAVSGPDATVAARVFRHGEQLWLLVGERPRRGGWRTELRKLDLARYCDDSVPP